MPDIMTYDAIYELVRKEKISEDIQSLPKDIYVQISNYLKIKERLYEEKKGQIDGERIKNQIDSSKKLIKELYEKREKKIINMALNKLKIGYVDDSALLDEEKKLLNDLSNLFNIYRDLFMKRLDENNKSEKKEAIENNKGLKTSELNENWKKSIQNEGLKIEDNTIIKTPIINKEEEIKKIRFMKEVPRFLGKNLEIYGPYKIGDIAELPKEFCEVIVKKEYAVYIED